MNEVAALMFGALAGVMLATWLITLCKLIWAVIDAIFFEPKRIAKDKAFEVAKIAYLKEVYGQLAQQVKQ